MPISLILVTRRVPSMVLYFDAGEFTDFKQETLFEKMTAFLHR